MRFLYTMKISSGIGALDRQKLTLLLRGTQSTISVNEATQILNVKRSYAAKLLTRWANKGWLARIKRGVYIPIPLESVTSNISLEDPWVVAEKLYLPCYIGGWSAAEYWHLTEQIFRSIVIFTIKKSRTQIQKIKDTEFLLRKTSEEAMFGLQKVWRGQVKVSVSDPSRTIIDLLADPKLGGGIRTVSEIFINYLNSEHKELLLLIDYAEKLNNGAVFKRLGFLLEKYSPLEVQIIQACKDRLTTGNNKLDPQLSADKLITRWRLWVPKNWEPHHD